MKPSDSTDVPPSSLYHYTSMETLEIILRSRKLRWSSPLTFNDPFDCQWDPMWQFYDPRILKLESELFLKLLKAGPDRKRIESSPKGKEFATTFRKYRQKYLKCLPSERPDFIAKAQQDLANMRAGISKDHLRILQSRLKQYRILCLSERPDSILMWSHYARGHSGALLELNPAALSPPGWKYRWLKVRYSEGLPEMFEEKGLVEVGIFDEKLEFKLPNPSMALLEIKDKQWEYEREWRAVCQSTNPRARSDDQSFGEDCIRSVTLGCKPRSERECNLELSLIRLLRSTFPNVMIRQASTSSTTFGLDFKLVT